MPLCTQFLDPVTRQPVSRNNQVDKEVAEAFGLRFSEQQFCWAFQAIEATGMAAMAKFGNGASLMTAEILDKYFAANPDIFADAEEMLKFKHFLCEKYIFTCWYQRH